MSQHGIWSQQSCPVQRGVKLFHTSHDTTEDINMLDTTVMGKFSKCCICHRFLSLHSRVRAFPAQENTKDAVCSISCIQILTQTVCFVQGFILGRVLSSFLGFHAKDTASEKALESLDAKPEISAVDGSDSCPCDNDGLSSLPVLFSPDSVSRGSSSGQLHERDIEAADQSLLFKPPAIKNFLLAAGVGSHRVNSVADVKVELQESSASASSSKLNQDTSFQPINSNSDLSTSSTVAVNFAQNKNIKRTHTIKKGGTVLGHKVKSKRKNKANSTKKSGDGKQNSNVACLSCGKVVCNRAALSNHLRSHCMQGSKSLRTCQVCGERYQGWSALIKHMRTLHEDVKPVSCDMCEEKFHTSKEYKRHQAVSHGKKYGVCHICGKHFTYRWTLMRHIQAHSGVRRFVCEHCGKGYLRQTTLIDHKTWAHLCICCKKVYTSCTCPGGPHKKRNILQSKRRRKLNCTAKNGISQEQMKRAKADILQCSICGEIRKNLLDYEAHIKAHKSERPFGCEFCDKRFDSKAGLFVHMYQHKEQRFHCDVCGKGFTYKCNLQRHREKHDISGRPVPCGMCQKKFKNEHDLKMHHDSVHSEKRVACHICGRTLTRLANLKRHIKVMHPEVKEGNE